MWNLTLIALYQRSIFRKLFICLSLYPECYDDQLYTKFIVLYLDLDAYLNTPPTHLPTDAHRSRSNCWVLPYALITNICISHLPPGQYFQVIVSTLQGSSKARNSFQFPNISKGQIKSLWLMWALYLFISDHTILIKTEVTFRTWNFLFVQLSSYVNETSLFRVLTSESPFTI